MRLSIYVKEIVRDFLIIFACIIIMITILRQIFVPDTGFDLSLIFTIMALSFLSALTGIILYTPHAISEKKMRIRIGIHFFILEILLISLSNIMGIVNSVSGTVILALEIAVVYAVIRALSYENDKKEAIKINERLKTFKKEM